MQAKIVLFLDTGFLCNMEPIREKAAIECVSFHVRLGDLPK